MRHRRILIPASGFYEWYRPADKRQAKQPYWIREANQQPFAFAGLAEHWMGKDGSELESGCILTVQSNSQIEKIHHRMPVVIKPEDYDRWLDCKSQEPRDVADLMQPVEEGFFEAIAVSDAVNKVKNTGPEIQSPISKQINEAPETNKKTKEPNNDQMDLF